MDLQILFEPRISQKVIFDSLQEHRFVVAICHRRLGKTLFAIFWLITQAIQSEEGMDHRGYYFGKTQKSAKLVAWHYFKKAGLVEYSETSLQIKFWNGSIITLAGSENIEVYRGIYIDALVGDEIASWVDASYSYNEVIRPALSDRMGKALFIGTVKGLDMLYELYQRGLSSEKLDYDWDSIKLPLSVTNILPESEVLELQNTMSSSAYDREFECNFFSETDDILITPEEVMQAMNRKLSIDEIASSKRAEVVFGVDIGRGSDPSVVYKRQGLITERLLSTKSPDNMDVADKISRLIKIHRPVSVFIDGGKGGGVIDRLGRLGHRSVVVEIYFNYSSPDDSCFNLRSYMYYQIKKFCSKGSLPFDEGLLKELVNQELDEDSNNRIRLVKKKKIRLRLGRSPNDGDALGLTFAEDDIDIYVDPDQRKKEMIELYMKESNIDYSDTNNYDPLNYMDSCMGN